jgi:hypothetical protein
VHLGQLPAGGERAGHVVGRQVDVSLDGERLAIGIVEVGRHPGLHDEERVEADEHVRRAGPGQARRLAVQRREIREVLVDQARGDQVVVRPRQSSRADIAGAQRREHAAGAREIDHLRGEVDTVDVANAARCEPRARAAGAATEIGGALDLGPRHVADLVQKPQVEVVLDGVLVGLRPQRVALAGRHTPVPALIEG